MRWPLLILFITFNVLAGENVQPPGQGEPSHCPDCHQKEYTEYQRSRMASAARTPYFLKEWADKGKVESCLECHAPSREDGITCGDCHGNGGHPYPRLGVPDICARCHDAPGEITVRSFRDSPAAKRGEGCLQCHLQGEGVSHDFRGPSRAGFLDGIASLSIAMRRDGDSYTALVRIRHIAGHALPGGTTGRSVWLVIEEYDAGNHRIDRREHRFGWVHQPGIGWKENTLPAGPGKVIEFRKVSLEKAGYLRGKLIYRFMPGGLERHDPDQVLLDQVDFILTPEMVR